MLSPELQIISTVLMVPLFSYCISRLLSPPKEIKIVDKAENGNRKSVFISGCDTGIGNRLAKYCADLGFQVFAGCLNPDDNGAVELKEYRSTDSTDNRIHVIPLDITNEKSVESAFRYVEEHVSDNGLWALVNNAGILVYGEFEWYTWKQCKQQIDVNLVGTMLLSKAFLKLIRKSKGRIVTLTSVNGRCAYPGISVYCASKFGLEGFSDSLRHEMKKFDVDVIVVQPGDYARLTSLMKDHRRKADEMWENMDSETKNVYDGYFQKYHDYIENNYGMTSPGNFEKSRLLVDLHAALVHEQPKVRYVSAPLYMKLIFALIRILPDEMGDRVISFLFSRIFKFHLSEHKGVQTAPAPSTAASQETEE